MAKVILISEEYIREWSPVNGTLDFKYLKQPIETSQDIHLQRLLGTDLLDHIKSLVEAGTITDGGNSDYKTLLDDKIRPALMWWTIYEAINFSVIKYDNANLAKRQAENTVTLTESEIAMTKADVNNKAMYYSERLVRYLCQNTDLFPEYSTNDEDDISPDSDGYDFGFEFTGK